MASTVLEHASASMVMQMGIALCSAQVGRRPLAPATACVMLSTYLARVLIIPQPGITRLLTAPYATQNMHPETAVRCAQSILRGQYVEATELATTGIVSVKQATVEQCVMLAEVCAFLICARLVCTVLYIKNPSL